VKLRVATGQQRSTWRQHPVLIALQETPTRVISWDLLQRYIRNHVHQSSTLRIVTIVVD
jgi:hypothetical protein